MRVNAGRASSRRDQETGVEIECKWLCALDHKFRRLNFNECLATSFNQGYSNVVWRKINLVVLLLVGRITYFCLGTMTATSAYKLALPRYSVSICYGASGNRIQICKYDGDFLLEKQRRESVSCLIRSNSCRIDCREKRWETLYSKKEIWHRTLQYRLVKRDGMNKIKLEFAYLS